MAAEQKDNPLQKMSSKANPQNRGRSTLAAIGALRAESRAKLEKKRKHHRAATPVARKITTVPTLSQVLDVKMATNS